MASPDGQQAAEALARIAASYVRETVLAGGAPAQALSGEQVTH
jgi:hypothetical protein